MYGVLLTPSAIRQPDQLVICWERDASRSPVVELSYRNFQDWVAHSRSFSQAAAIGSSTWPAILDGRGESVRLASAGLRLACRGLWRAKAFAVAAVLTLAIGIAGTTVMFALIQGVLLRPLPVLEQDRLLVAWKEVRSSGSAHYPFGNTEIESVAEASQLLENAAGVGRHGAGRAIMVESGVANYVNVALVTGRFFDVLGVGPLLGRTLAPADDVDGAENVVVISHGLWQRRYGASPEVIGRRLILSD